jgi:signal transduction histidine kinase
MIRLLPSYAYDYEQLWELLIRRNKWLINIRYVVFAAISIFTLASLFVLKLEFSRCQLVALIIISITILAYNIFFNSLIRTSLIKNDPNHFNPLHVSLLQISADLIALAFLTYYTGGIESPFYVFFIFHMIIGSLILPGTVVYSMALVIIVFFYSASLFEYFEIIPHYKFGALLKTPIYNNLDYILIFATSFGAMMIVSVFLANNIVRTLYMREKELKITLDKLNEAEVVKQKYTVAVVHEIKSPIASVQSYLDLILQKFTGPINPQVEEKLQRARVRSDEAIQIINDVLNISRLRLQPQVKKDEINISELVTKIIFKKKIQADSINIGINFYDLRLNKINIKGDYGLLELAFSNLIGNAIKYSNIGGNIEVVLEDGRQEKEISIEICDNGIGIPEKDKDKIFKEFFRASNVRQESHEGTGLGLSIVKQVIEQHGGTITFESPSRLANEIGKGTCFKVFIGREQVSN